MLIVWNESLASADGKNDPNSKFELRQLGLSGIVPVER